MKNVRVSRAILLLPFLLFHAAIQAQNVPNDVRQQYIEQFKEIAIKEMDRAGIPASIKLGQAILESNAGQSTLAVQANNHFGIKCHSGWNGKSYYHKDDDRDANGNIVESCFRSYRKAEESFRDHSDFLTDPKKFARYGHLFNLRKDDYKSWAYGLQASGYATSPVYADNLIRVIETYKLFNYDAPESGAGQDGNLVLGGSGFPAGGRKSGRVNDTKAVASFAKETIEDIARSYGISPAKVRCYNDCQYELGQVLPEGTRVFIQQKYKKWRGSAKTHTVKEGETMFTIAQHYGIRLESLYDMNGIPGGKQPAYGEKLILRTGLFGGKRKDPVSLREDGPQVPPVAPPPSTGPGTRPGTTTAPTPGTPKPSTDPGGVLPPGGVFRPDETGLFEVEGSSSGKVNTPPSNPTPTPQPTPGTIPSGTVITTGTTRPDAPVYNPAPTLPSSTGSGTVGGYVPPSPPQPPAGGSVAGTHTVAKGDTLYNISRRYGLTVEQLKSMNGLAADYIQIGQVLRVK